MPRKKSLIPANTMYDIVMLADREIRVSKPALKAISQILEEVGLKLAKEAVVLCRHAGRKTVKKEDIEMAKSRVS